MLIGGDRLGENGTCYTGGLPIKKSFQQCDVTNKKITDMLPGRPPTVAFDCDAQVSSNPPLPLHPSFSGKWMIAN